MINIREFQENDYWEVENLVRKFMNNDPFSPPIIVRQMQSLFTPFFLIAEDDEKEHKNVLGYIMGGIEYNKRSIGWILEIFVEEESRNHGIGNKLIKSLINQMNINNVEEIRLTVDPLNHSALTIYYMNGFVKEDCLSEFYRKEKRVLLLKRIIQ